MRKCTDLIIAWFVLACAVTTKAGEIEMPVCGQEKSNWCWAASCESILKAYHVVNVSQTDIVTYIKGSPVDVGGNESEMKNALNHFGSCNAQAQGLLPEATIKQHADDYHPFIIGWQFSGGGGHAVDYAGYKESKDRVMYKIMNPSPMGSGKWQYMTYQAICNAENTGTWTVSVPTSKQVTQLSLTSMNDGGKFVHGDQLSITWSAGFTSAIKIELFKGTVKVADIGSVAASTSSHTWTIPANNPSGVDFKIKIYKADEILAADLSERAFTINTPPAFTSDSVCSAVYQQQFNYTVTATDNDNLSDLDITLLANLPAGVTFTYNNNGTATIDGTPKIYGTFKFELALFDKYVEMPLMQNFTLTITDQGEPVITKQPKADTVMVGDSAVFEIEAAGYSLSYQWKENGLDITGESKTRLVLKNVKLEDNGKIYQCVVTNPSGKVRSLSVTLTVTEISEIIWHPLMLSGTRAVFGLKTNPVDRSGKSASFVICVPGLRSGSLRILDATGSMVDKITVVKNGEYRWKLTNRSGRKVSSGMYRAILTVQCSDGKLSVFQCMAGVR